MHLWVLSVSLYLVSITRQACIMSNTNLLYTVYAFIFILGRYSRNDIKSHAFGILYSVVQVIHKAINMDEKTDPAQLDRL